MIAVRVNGSSATCADGVPAETPGGVGTALSWPFPVPSGDDDDQLERVRAHEAAADTLAERGDWHRAYRHLKAAVTLARTARAADVVPTEQLHSEVDRLRRERAEAREQSRRDALTAGYNRRYLDERLATWRGRERAPVCVALADVDHFKQINDAHGHGLGDEVLRRLVMVMNSGLPPDGFCARYGGEEFALVLPGTGAEDAVALCENIRARVDGQDWDDLVPGMRITVSFGVSCLADAAAPAPDPARPAPAERPASALDAADALLYVAKRAGRNAVAYRDADSGEVMLAGPAARRRGLLAATRSLLIRP